ncbi:carboxymuconolactone decarboxylase family protein [Methylosinus sp. Sm6]|uniref:carboxymuconolactone decarboxylase family protein n=1 Tax=Methylosinus sp. Sm6 TaxID=2866948 RepID=UPI00210613D0|nr:carboxymuconolactone decarboxylase family protein [Methylosinus sp. Sm6]
MICPSISRPRYWECASSPLSRPPRSASCPAHWFIRRSEQGSETYSTPALRSSATVRVSQINQCAFCVDINSATLAKRGVAMEKIDALANWRDSPLFAADERLALEYAEATTLTEPGVSDGLRARLSVLEIQCGVSPPSPESRRTAARVDNEVDDAPAPIENFRGTVVA